MNSEMQKEWESWEYHIAEALKNVENKIQACYRGMATFGVSEKEREAFVLRQLEKLIMNSVR